MKTREIRDRIKSMGFERGAVYTLEAMNEELLQTRRDLNELAVMFDKLVSAMDGMMEVAGSMKDYLDKTKLREEQLGVNTQSLGLDDE